ncbi:MAG: hypothetical protein JST62_03850 [Bacteroidetes bacterium]|nr:hypothetical protein [Bacteroidota bacterium]
MIALKLLKKYIIDSQIFVSLMGTLLATFFMLEQNTFRFPTFFLIFLTYFSGYIYTKYQYSKKLPFILAICFVIGVICSLLIIKNHNIDRLYKWVIICFLGLLYNSFFLKLYIRNIPLLKIFYVGLVWGLMNAWLSFPIFNFPIFIISFIFITALVLPFDIRDMNKDKVLTFPQIIGVKKTKILASFLVVLSVVLAYFYLSPSYFIAFLFASLPTITLIYFSENYRPDYYFSLIVESCSGLPFLFLMIMKYF